MAVSSSSSFNPIPLNHRERAAKGLRLRDHFPYDQLKRLFDIAGSLILLCLFAPLMLVVALIVKISSPGPVIFKQQRLTQGGRIFTMYKFRTMRFEKNPVSTEIWTTKRDPRVTPAGRIIRKFRIDELPQLLNVLRGEMSIIGPRPERPDIAKQLAIVFPSFNRRLNVKAGITGLAQTGNGYAGCVSSYRKKLAYDLMYIKHRCLFLDLRIALKTIIVMLTGAGAR